MKRYATASLTGLNSSEIYSLHYPDSLLKFCSFDFSGFVRRTTDFCKKCQANGEFYIDEAIALRNSISACHKFYEANIHTLYEKIIQDFFIEYICREKGIGPAALWNNYIQSMNNLEKTLFTRLTEYRHGKAVNQWVNLLKIQDYAKKKTEFVFSQKADLITAGARRDYFDLTFIVAANELGYPTDSFGTARMYSVGRLPSAPFILSTVSKEIAKTTLSGMEYPEEEISTFAPIKSDTQAMDVFSHIKGLIPEKPDTLIGTVVNTMRSMPKKVYVAESFKSVIDLEIDLMLENGMVLYRCERCDEYFVRNKEYDEIYCDVEQPNGRTCYEISNMVPLRTAEEIEELDAMTNELYSYMSKRINVDLTQRDFSEWYQYFMAIKENIAHRKLSVEEFRDFERYSKELKFTPSQQESAPEKTEETKPSDEPKIKPFVFERVDRRELDEQEFRRRKREAEEEEEEELFIPPAVEEVAHEATPTVKVMKAESAKVMDVSLFENPFDGAFDESISELSRVNERTFKPLDDIFSFGKNAEENKENEVVPETAKYEEVEYEDEEYEEEDYEEYEEEAYGEEDFEEEQYERIENDGFVEDKPPVISIDFGANSNANLAAGEEEVGGFDKEIAKAAYIREPNVTRKKYAADMYTKTANNNSDNLFPTFASDNMKGMNGDDDFDILPAVPSITLSEEKPKGKDDPRVAEAYEKAKKKKNMLKIPFGEAGYTNKTQRVLDGLFSPVKAKNPFLTEGHDDEE